MENDKSSDENINDESTVDPVILSNFVHQIIAPLNAVVGTVDNMMQNIVPKDKLPQRLSAMRGQLVTTIELVRNLAYLAQLRTTEGQRGLMNKAGPVVLPKVVIEAAQFFKSNAEHRGITIHLYDRDIQYAVRGLTDLLRQVFSNIFENAVKYSDENSTVEVWIRPQKKTGQLLVEITNQGPGFREHERGSLFRLGFRGEDAKSMRASGSGLGLAICKNILDMHDATMEAEHARVHRKTTFRIRFAKYHIDESRGKG